MEISHVSISTDEDGNPVFQPGLILTRGDRIVVKDIREQTLVDTFKIKAKKILPDTDIHRSDDMTMHPRYINVMVKSDKTASWFAKLSNESMRDAPMVFGYRGIWATFHYDSTEKHVRDALNAWKIELRHDAEEKGIKVHVAAGDVTCMQSLSYALRNLPDDADYLMVFADASTKPIYDAFQVDMEEWHSLLFHMEGEQALLRTFDKSVSKADLRLKKDEPLQPCVVCSKPSEKARCKNCKRDFQCSSCLSTARNAFANGKNARCTICETYIPVFLKNIHMFALHEERDGTVMEQQMERLKKMYGGQVYIL